MILRLVSALVLTLLFTISGRAETWQSGELNCAIELPSEVGWTKVSPPIETVKFSIRFPDETKVISLFVSAIEPKADEKDFLERFKKNWFEHGTGKGKSEESIQINGYAAYRLKDIAILAGNEVYRAATIVVYGGKLYQIDVMGAGSDPWKDSVVAECVASFRFVGQAPSAGQESPDSSRIDKIPELIADIMCGVLVVVVIVFAIVKTVRRKEG